ncbi:hypothetical protein BV25DRAFT_851771 [Artomyces pyxidatus]|uniref:Uncharacterized protein n=1 Tax=Artomyces pyxidatus TaxID=48021 RepID=A0ACB8TH39_9AGAM|nr:hypothetical protein BV25DRAFT_851771 [Artomyces pyxidatus]
MFLVCPFLVSALIITFISLAIMPIHDRIRLAGLDTMVAHLVIPFPSVRATFFSSSKHGFLSAHRNKRSHPAKRDSLGDDTTIEVDFASQNSSRTLQSLSAPFDDVSVGNEQSVKKLSKVSGDAVILSPPPVVSVDIANPSSPLPSFLPDLCTSPISPSPDHHGPDYDDTNYAAAACTHPNSPYIPWTSSVRSQIMCPPSSTLLAPSIPEPTSELPAYCSEPTQASSLHGSRGVLTKASRRVKKFGGKLRKNVTGLARFVEKYATRKPHVFIPPNSYPILYASDLDLTPSFLESRSSISTTSTISISLSSDFDTLADWLAHRNNMAREAPDCSVMDIDEYERRGSWLEPMPPTMDGDDELINSPFWAAYGDSQIVVPTAQAADDHRIFHSLPRLPSEVTG